MGAGTIQPVLTRYTQVARLKHERLVANAIEAAEQCEVLSVPRVEAEVTLDRLIDGWPGDRVLILADEGEASSSPVEALSALRGRKVGLLIGPEGGFSDEERSRLRACPMSSRSASDHDPARRYSRSGCSGRDSSYHR